MTTYLLPCSCSATTEIGPGQAGGTVICRQCGASLTVPKLRDFRHLEMAPLRRPPAAGRWSWQHAIMLVGATVAISAGVGSAVVGTAPRSMIDTQMIRAAVAAADERSIIEAWKSLSSSGVDRPPAPAEQAVQRIARFRRGAATGLMVLGAAGAIAAIAAGIALATPRKESA